MPGFPFSPAVTSLEELDELVDAVRAQGVFVFDVETRGIISHHPEILEAIAAEWEEKQKTLKSEHPSVLAASYQAIVDRRTEALQLDTLRNDVFWIGIATQGRSWAIPMGHPNGEKIVDELRYHGVPPMHLRTLTPTGKRSKAKKNVFVPAVFTDPPTQLTQEQVFGKLRPLFLDETITKVNQRIKFDARSIVKYVGELPRGPYRCTQVLAAILNENLPSYDLEALIQANTFPGKFVRIGPGTKLDAGYNPYANSGKLGKTLTTEAFSDATRYVHYDVRFAWLIYRMMWEKIVRDPELHSIALQDSDCLRPLAQAEMNGIHVNRREMANLGKALDRQIDQLLVELNPHTPPGFNPASNPAKSKLLFGPKSEGGLGLKAKKFTDKERKKPSVDAESLTLLKGEHPVVDMLIKYNELNKMKGTYVLGLSDLLYPTEHGKNIGRLHANFNLHRTNTGRLSSSEPNMQNVPRDGEVRDLFIAAPGDSLIDADYSQIEMRLMAMFSQDTEMLRIFDAGIDPHAATAGVILHGKADAEVTKLQRQEIGKVANFLLGYLGSGYRVQQYMAEQGKNITLAEGWDIVDGYRNGYSGYSEWQEEIIKFGRRHGYVKTLGGRVRHLPSMVGETNQYYTDKKSAGRRRYSSNDRMAVNFVIQGTAAEICKEAIIELDKALDWPRCKLLLQVHDELVVSVPTDELKQWVPVIEQSMGNGRLLRVNDSDKPVTLLAEAHFGGTWGQVK